MSNKIPITESDLQAYVDKQLSAERRKIVEQWLNKNPDELQRLKTYESISHALHKHYDPVVSATVPDKFVKLCSKFKKKQSVYQPFKFALLFSLFFAGLFTGWLSKPTQVNTNVHPLLMHLVKPAAFAHSVYVSDKIKPVEINAVNQSQLTHWLSDRLRMPIKPPVLEKYSYYLIGGRLIPSTNRMAAQFMYENLEGKRITLYIRRINVVQFTKQQHDVMHMTEAGLTTLFWRQGNLGYALSGDADNKALLKIANATRALHRI